MSTTDPVVLLGGLTVPRGALELVIDLVERGVQLRIEDADVLDVSPSTRLTDDDRAGLRRWKWHIIALLNYDVENHRPH